MCSHTGFLARLVEHDAFTPRGMYALSFIVEQDGICPTEVDSLKTFGVNKLKLLLTWCQHWAQVESLGLKQNGITTPRQSDLIAAAAAGMTIDVSAVSRLRNEIVKEVTFH